MYKDIEKFNPKFVRTERETTNYETGIDYNENIIFDFDNGDYAARNKERYGNLTLKEYLDKIEREKGFVSYHISLRSADNKRALLVFESDEVGGDEIIKKLTRLVRDKGIKFILKTSGNRSLHLIIPIIAETEEDYSRQWLGIFYLLDARDREFIDEQLNKFSGQVRGFESLHLKTYDKSEVLESG
jgi:hypothetical protein